MRRILVFWVALWVVGVAASESTAVALVPGDIVFTTFSYPNPGDGMVYHVHGVTGVVTLVASGGLLGSHPDAQHPLDAGQTQIHGLGRPWDRTRIQNGPVHGAA